MLQSSATLEWAFVLDYGKNHAKETVSEEKLMFSHLSKNIQKNRMDPKSLIVMDNK